MYTSTTTPADVDVLLRLQERNAEAELLDAALGGVRSLALRNEYIHCVPELRTLEGLLEALAQQDDTPPAPSPRASA